MGQTKFWPPGSLRAHKFLQPRFTVAPFLPSGGICVMHGPPGVGKSQLALTLARCIARGEDFLTPEHPTTQGKVLYIQVNMPIQEQQARVLVTDVGAADQIAFLSLEHGMLDSEHLQPANRDPGLVEAKRFQPDVVVIDTLRDVHTMEEIDSATVTKVYGAWKQLFPDSTLIFIHHDRKLPLPTKGSNGIPERYWLEAARGSSTWLGNADSGLHLTDAKGALTLSFSKTRTCAPIAPMSVRLAAGTLLVELTQPTTRQRLGAWGQLNPKATHAEAAKFLVDVCKVSRQRASILVKEVLGI